MTIIIIGGGIAGLTAAYRLEELGLEYKLIEAKRFGGRILSQEIEHNDKSFIQDMGAEYFLSTDTYLLDLLEDLQLSTDTYLSQRAIFNNQDHSSMILPSSQDSFWQGLRKKLGSIRYLGLSNLSSAGKLQQMLPDLFDKISFLYESLEDTDLDEVYLDVAAEFSDITDQDLMAYLTAHGFSEEFVMKMVDPLFHAIYMLDSKRLNALFGILGFASKNATIYHVQGGNMRIIDTLRGSIPASNIQLDRVIGIVKDADGYTVEFADSGEVVRGSHVYLAIPHAALNSIAFSGLESEEEAKLKHLQGIEYNSHVFHHLIEGTPIAKLNRVFDSGANTVFIAHPADIVEINAIVKSDGVSSGLYDVTSSKPYDKTQFSTYFAQYQARHSQHWQNAYPIFDRSYFSNFPRPKISSTLYCGADSFISSMGNSVMMSELIIREIADQYKISEDLTIKT